MRCWHPDRRFANPLGFSSVWENDKDRKMDKQKIKYVVVIQCANAKKRCSGFACSNCFFDRSCAFAGSPEGTKFLMTDCGGCCGSGVAGVLEHFSAKLGKKTSITKDQVAIHLSSCMVTDNHHHDRCPNISYMRDIIAKKGYANVVEGTYQSPGATAKRNSGEYRTHESVAF